MQLVWDGTNSLRPNNSPGFKAKWYCSRPWTLNTDWDNFVLRTSCYFKLPAKGVEGRQRALWKGTGDSECCLGVGRRCSQRNLPGERPGRVKLELSRLMEGKMGFGGQSRGSDFHKEQKRIYKYKNEKRMWHRSAGLEKRMGKNWLASQCVFEQSDELKQVQLSSRTLIICWKKLTCSSTEIHVYIWNSRSFCLIIESLLCSWLH